MYKLSAGLILMSLLFLGCVPKMELTKLPELYKDKNDTATVFFVRKCNYFTAGKYSYPTIDNQNIAGLRRNDYTKVVVSSGKHDLGVRFWGIVSHGIPFLVMSTEGWVHKTIKVDLLKGREYFYMIDPDFLRIRDDIIKFPEDQARKIISQSYEVSPGNQSALGFWEMFIAAYTFSVCDEKESEI